METMLTIDFVNSKTEKEDYRYIIAVGEFKKKKDGVMFWSNDININNLNFDDAEKIRTIINNELEKCGNINILEWLKNKCCD